MSLEGMITDRTASDVALWNKLRLKPWAEMSSDERNTWMGAASRGAYNYTDLNRVERAVEYLASRLDKWNIRLNLKTKTDWKQSDGLTGAEAARYLGNVRKVMAACGADKLGLTLPSSMNRLNYAGANRIEEVLVAVDQYITICENAHIYSGEIFGGEV